jgi:hypothetical protein
MYSEEKIRWDRVLYLKVIRARKNLPRIVPLSKRKGFVIM